MLSSALVFYLSFRRDMTIFALGWLLSLDDALPIPIPIPEGRRAWIFDWARCCKVSGELPPTATSATAVTAETNDFSGEEEDEDEDTGDEECWAEVVDDDDDDAGAEDTADEDEVDEDEVDDDDVVPVSKFDEESVFLTNRSCCMRCEMNSVQ